MYSSTIPMLSSFSTTVLSARLSMPHLRSHVVADQIQRRAARERRHDALDAVAVDVPDSRGCTGTLEVLGERSGRLRLDGHAVVVGREPFALVADVLADARRYAAAPGHCAAAGVDERCADDDCRVV